MELSVFDLGPRPEPAVADTAAAPARVAAGRPEGFGALLEAYLRHAEPMTDDAPPDAVAPAATTADLTSEGNEAARGAGGEHDSLKRDDDRDVGKPQAHSSTALVVPVAVATVSAVLVAAHPDALIESIEITPPIEKTGALASAAVGPTSFDLAQVLPVAVPPLAPSPIPGAVDATAPPALPVQAIAPGSVPLVNLPANETPVSAHQAVALATSDGGAPPVEPLPHDAPIQNLPDHPQNNVTVAVGSADPPKITGVQTSEIEAALEDAVRTSDQVFSDAPVAVKVTVRAAPPAVESAGSEAVEPPTQQAGLILGSRAIDDTADVNDGLVPKSDLAARESRADDARAAAFEPD